MKENDVVKMRIHSGGFKIQIESELNRYFAEQMWDGITYYGQRIKRYDEALDFYDRRNYGKVKHSPPRLRDLANACDSLVRHGKWRQVGFIEIVLHRDGTTVISRTVEEPGGELPKEIAEWAKI